MRVWLLHATAPLQRNPCPFCLMHVSLKNRKFSRGLFNNLCFADKIMRICHPISTWSCNTLFQESKMTFILSHTLYVAQFWAKVLFQTKTVYTLYSLGFFAAPPPQKTEQIITKHGESRFCMAITNMLA